MIPKCGEIVRWHWAHHSAPECDDWHANETEWHLEWKEKFPAECQEVIIERSGKRHRADVMLQGEVIIEFQNSSIHMSDVKAREAFYGKRMSWVWNCRAAAGAGRLNLRDRGDYTTFRWDRPRRTPSRCSRPMFFDVGREKILDVRRIYGDTRTSGWGYLRSYEDFVGDMMLKNPRGWMTALYRGPETKFQWLDGIDPASAEAEFLRSVAEAPV